MSESNVFECPKCHGTGEIPCPVCDGHGAIRVVPGWEDCENCAGNGCSYGYIRCDYCGGKGSF